MFVPMLFLVQIIELIVVVALIYLYILICKYLKMLLNGKEKSNQNIVIINNNKKLFLKDDSNGLLLNTALIKDLYIKDLTIFVELISGDLYRLKQCKDDGDAKNSLYELEKELNVV